MSSCLPPLLLLCGLLGHGSGLRPETPQVPFLPMWNAPALSCLSKYGVDLDLGPFNITQNPEDGENITIFYADKLGLYPRYLSQGEAVNGGVPQNTSLNEHLRVAFKDIHTYIPDRGFHGMAVVDWESWRPVWERNWGSKQVYVEASKELVRVMHPDWNPEQVNAAAQVSFEEAGRKFMEETLKLGRTERPDGLWGYYGFPDCYNYLGKELNYSGECPAVQMKTNDKLLWLWNSSSALYPDIYLSLNLRGLSEEVLFYSRHRIMEAMRVGAQVTPSAPPVYPYSRIVYTYTLEFLSQEHLVYTVGESAALGSAGVVLWGNSAFSKSKATCEAVKSYIDQILGRYLVNVTTAAALCSQELCSSRGRCQRMNPTSRAYLHLDPAVWKVVSEDGSDGRKKYKALRRTRADAVTFMRSEFRCMCFPGWEGEGCSKPTRG